MEFILETLGKVGFEWRMGLFNLINFGIVFLILKKYAFGPVMKTINERQDQINESANQILEAKTKLQMAEKKAQEIIDEAKVEANKVVEASHDAAKTQAETMTKNARTEIETLVAQAKKKIDSDREEMHDNLKRETVELVITVAEKILGQKLDGKSDEKFIEDILKSSSK